MSRDHMSSEPVRAYLLGALGENDATSVEERYFTDREFFLFVQAVETELIEDYLAGRLPPPVKERFEARYLSMPDLRHRLEEVRAQLSVQAPAPKAGHRPWLLAAAMLFVCVGGVVLWQYRDRLGFEALQSPKSARPLLATLTLRPGVLKGEGGVSQKLGRFAELGDVRMELEIPGQRDRALCMAQVSAALPDGTWKRIWVTPRPLWSDPSEGGQRLVLVIDSSLLTPGDYLVELTGVHLQIQESYSFRASSM